MNPQTALRHADGAPAELHAVHQHESDAPRPRFWLAAGVLAALHLALVNYFLPLTRVFRNEPLYGIDYDLHIGQVFRAVEALDRWGKSWSYDVQLLAGHPEGTITDSGSKGWELYTFALYRLGVPKAIAYNSFILLVMCSSPLLIYAAARKFDLSRPTSLLATYMAASLWFFDSYLHWVWFVGMISWCGAASLALLCLAIFQRWVRSPNALMAAQSGGLLGISLLIHPYTFFILGPPMAAVYLRSFRKLRASEHASVVGMAAFAIAVNAYWLHNALQHWHYILDSAVYAQADPLYAVFDAFDLLYSGSDTGIVGARAGLRILYAGLGAAGLALWIKRRDARWLPFLCSIAPLYAVSYLACYVPGMQQTQPYRQIIPAMLLSTMPSAVFVMELIESRALEGLSRGGTALLALLSFGLAQQLFASQVSYFLPSLLPELKLGPERKDTAISKYGFPWRPGLPSNVLFSVPHGPTIEYDTDKLVRWVETHIPAGARVLVEGPVLGERFAWRGNYEVLGGFFERNVQHVDANYFRAHRGLAVNPQELEHYLRTYAVDYVIKESRDFDDLSTLFTRVGTSYGRRVYKTRLPIARVLEGSGSVHASTNSIEVHASAPAQPLLLSYHWHESLRCKPDCRVERGPIDIDRVGFIRIPAPHPADLTVWNSYERW